MVVSGLKIREMTVADHIVVGEVGFTAWQSSDAFRNVELSAETVERTRLAYMAFATEAMGDVRLAEVDGTVVGWCARDSEPDYVSDLWMQPEWQGRGIGRALLVDALERIRGAGFAKARIHTHANNDGAIRLYERCGFRIIWSGSEYSRSMGITLEKVHMEADLR